MHDDGELQGECLEGAGEVADAYGGRESEDGFGFEHDCLLSLRFRFYGAVWEGFGIDAELGRWVRVVECGGEGADGAGGAVGEV